MTSNQATWKLVVGLIAALAIAIHVHADCTHNSDHNGDHEHNDHAHMHDDALVHDDETIGTVDFGADCNESVRADFDRALGLMHHMMYVQSRGEYESIAETDPDCAMAHWGVATTLFQPLWGTTPSDEDFERAEVAIDRARASVESERERLLIEATAAFFEADTEHLGVRLNAWADGMDAAYQAYPEDHDVAALYSLGLLTRALSADDHHALHAEAEEILQKIFDAEPTHPGSIHYAIHATDAEGRAENMLHMVEAYGEIAPTVPHALHMPSHIYVRLGDWPEVIDWNERSSEAALEHDVNGAVSYHYIHAIDYLVYGHLQRGEDSVAENVWKTAQDKGRHQGGFVGAFHLAAIPARLAVEQRDWERAAQLDSHTPDYIEWESFEWPEGLNWYARGLGAVHTDDLEGARKAAASLEALSDQARAAADERFTVYIDVDRYILEGWIAHAEGDAERAVKSMRKAVDLESSVEKHPVTPGALLPPGEALGDLLRTLERPAAALDAYSEADKIWPGRYNTLFGAMIAAEQAGDDQAASQWAERLLSVAPQAERPNIERARVTVLHD